MRLDPARIDETRAPEVDPEVTNGSTGGNGKYGVAQLSPSLLYPPAGLTLKQSTCGELFGYGYLALPLTKPKSTTAGVAIPTGNHNWTLFLNTGNFKGPLAFFTPYFWSQVAVAQPQWSGAFNCPSR